MTKKLGLLDLITQAPSIRRGFTACQWHKDTAALLKDLCYSAFADSTRCFQVYLIALIAVAFSNKSNVGTSGRCYPTSLHKYTLNFAI